MNQGKQAMKIFVIFMLSLTLTAGYAQAMPSIYNLGAHRSSTFSTISISDLLSSDSFLIFGSYFRDFSKPDISSPSKMISKDEAISIAKGLWPTATWTGIARAQLRGGVWIVTLTGFAKDWEGDCPEGYVIPGTCAGGEVKIDAKTGEIIFVNPYL